MKRRHGWNPKFLVSAGLAIAVAVTLLLSVARIASAVGEVSWWKFDEGSETVAADSAGSNHGTVYGATWTTGRVGGALSFDGVNDYVSVPNTPNLNIVGDITLETWVKCNTTSQKWAATAVTRGSDAAGGFGAALHRSQSQNGFSVVIETAWGAAQYTAPFPALDTNWHHLVGVRSGSNIYAYIDGVSYSQVTLPSGPLRNPTPTVRIGTDAWDFNYFNGLVDEVKIYNRALSAAEIQAEYQAGAPPDTTPPTAPTGLTKISPDNNPLPAFKWNGATDTGSGVASYEVQMDSGAWTNIGNRLTYVQPAVLGKGSHTFSVQAKDNAGNTGAAATLNSNVSVVADLANTRIAFSSYRFDDWEIYTMNADGSVPTNLTNHPADDYHPAWSPDGTRIAFHSFRDGNPEIYVISADGSNPTRLTSNGAADYIPVWSPDGSKILLFSSRDHWAFEIYVMNAAGSSPTRLTSNTAEDYLSDWSPDGTKIVFESKRDHNNKEIYMMNADGSNPTRLTYNSTYDYHPKWSPFLEKADTTTSVSSAQNPSAYGQSVTFTATVTSSGGTPTGTVQFKIDGADFRALVPLSGGSATSGATSTLTVGNHTVSAVYSGDSNFNGSTSPTLTQTVNVTYDSLGNLVKKFVTKQGIVNSLLAKLDNAQKAEAKGNAKAGMIGAFINEVEAQTGKAISPENAAILIALAKTL